nr:hypothetical protein [Acidomonas methanolica]
MAALPLSMTPARAEPGGCLKYGAAGAVAGHMVHHGVLGAAGGCVTGMWRRHEYRKGVREKAAAYDKEHAGDAARLTPSSGSQSQQTSPSANGAAQAQPQ